MEFHSWSLRFVLALLVATALWASAASLANRLLCRRAVHPIENAQLARAAGAVGEQPRNR